MLIVVRLDQISTNTFRYINCCAANVYMFVYILIGAPIVPSNAEGDSISNKRNFTTNDDSGASMMRVFSLFHSLVANYIWQNLNMNELN